MAPLLLIRLGMDIQVLTVNDYSKMTSTQYCEVLRLQAWTMIAHR